MNTKQKTVIGVGLAVVIAMALYPPWATWCIPVDERDLQNGPTNTVWLAFRTGEPYFLNRSVCAYNQRKASIAFDSGVSRQTGKHWLWNVCQNRRWTTPEKTLMLRTAVAAGTERRRVVFCNGESRCST